MAEQLALSELRFPPEIGAAVQKDVEALGLTVAAEDEAAKAKKQTTAFPRSPFIMFINGKSGGRLGPDLLRISAELLTPVQVFDLQAAKPHKVIPTVLGCLDKLAQESGNESAKAVRANLKMFVAGGDGTVGWLLSVVESIDSPPPVAVIPLGTGNDLSRSYGWGPTFSVATTDRMERRLLEGAVGTLCNLDSWVLKVTPSPDMDATELESLLPPALHRGTTTGEDGSELAQFTGNFYNYFSCGMDAQVAYAFHHLRNTKPGIARGPRVNKVIYATYGCTQGWFCAPCAPQLNTRRLHMAANIQIQKEANGPFIDLPLPTSLNALMVLNLQSYAGGRNPWGSPEQAVEQQHGWTTARPDDAKLEILGLTDGWHSLMMLGKLKGGLRLAQAFGIRIELRGEHRAATYLQLDGEPWEQRLSQDSRQPTVVEITRKSRPALMLANQDAQVLQLPAKPAQAAPAAPAAPPAAPQAAVAEAAPETAAAAVAGAAMPGTAPPANGGAAPS